MQLVKSPEAARRAIAEIGVERLYPDLRTSPAPRREAEALKRFSRALSAEAPPRTPALSLTFAHRDAAIAAEALNRLVAHYLDHRREVLFGGESSALAGQVGDFDARVGTANAALAAFLAANEIGDFDSELAAAAARAGEIETLWIEAQSKRSEAEGRARALAARHNAEPAEIALYSESDARGALVRLQLEREEMLARFQPDAPPVREIDRRIQQLTAFLDSGDASGLTRRGPNPVRQELASSLFAAEAEARAQGARVQELTTQRNALRERLQHLQALAPRYRQLARERTILEDAARSFAARAEESRAYDQLLGRSTDSISLVERATAPEQAQSLRGPLVVLSGSFSLRSPA
jgi:uncharacterized protein involved in exopolysaccharide biosynthesis